ncbi:hypothetical protein Q5P01_015203 [Channa striata]|uniref:Uncharacterized protein n=1 Tax=Channa striata TaxID=64152 RepID=A0AA88MGV9_CHASR|nr:hypothetical protein Q5P01_015203 [Channa striata]
MNCRAGFLNVLCAWLVILLPNTDAGHAPKAHAAGLTCRPKELTALTKRQVNKSLDSFDKANGKHLGTWSPGFPELHVHDNASFNGSKVQCSLIFMDHGLGRILEDQRNNLNPEDVLLHKLLEDTVSRVSMLTNCVKHILGGECSPKPPRPEMPVHAFERKQWSHTLLKEARDYLDWLERKFEPQTSKVKGTVKRKRKVVKPRYLKYLEGSGYLL